MVFEYRIYNRTLAAARSDALLGALIPAGVYGGNDTHQRSDGAAVAWSDIESWLEESV